MAPTLTREPGTNVSGVAGDRVRVLVLFGGRSSEHAISCLSAAGILRALDPARYDVTAVGILPDGRWMRVDPDPAAIGAVRSGVLPSVVDTGDAAVLLPEPVEGVEAPIAIRDVDVVFPALHGPWGEDGTVQGLLEMAGIPYVGSGVFASSAAMDKGHMKALLSAGGLPVGASTVITAAQWERDAAAARARVDALGYPVFVKPARAGSSVGISKVHGPGELEAAIDAARAWDPRVIVEAAIADAREIECAVIVDESGTPQATRCAEIIVGGNHEFYDFEAKYLDDAAELVVPADLPAEVEAEVRRLAVEAFGALDCEGLARVDFFVTPDHVILNEVNTMPGFTPISLFPRMCAASGIDYASVLDLLIADALRRGTGLR
ncbi:MAG: D-alanine--D-alanine ligase family protein [Candidatus Nanopelagicales bacterium]